MNTQAKKKEPKVKADRVLINSERLKLPLTKYGIKRLVVKILSLLKEEDSRVSLVFVNDEGMRKLNWKYRKINRTTDCLAFPMREGEDSQLNPELLGDVVISVDAVKRNAKSFGADIKGEMTLYIVHGILHLLGFDDATRRRRNKMKNLEEDILRRL